MINNALKAMPEEMANIPILARLWQEDGVWNVSAFDAPIVAYGENLDEARSNFIEAVQCHFQALKHFNELHEAAANLRSIAEQHGFYADRVRPQTLLEDFSLAAHIENYAS